jgi:hypothetical protein
MDKRRSLQYNFGLEAIPVLFHSQTTHFLKFLEKDGLKFLNFWWNHVGDRLPEEKRVSSNGMSFEIEDLDEKTRLIIISLPTPKEDKDPYFVGLVARPERRLLWVRLPTTQAFALIRDDLSGQTNKTSLGYLTPNGLFRPRGIGLAPTKLDFKRIVKSNLKKKKGKNK